MAENRKNVYRRRAGSYVEGNTARRLDEFPDVPTRRNNQASGNEKAKNRSRTSSAEALSTNVIRNREKAAGLNKGYVAFLALCCILILVVSVHYLQLQNEITSRKKVVANLESEVNQLKEENDAYYSQVTSDLDLDEIKKVAIGRLGMRLPDENQIQTYEIEGRSYVRQFQDIPDEK